MSTSPIAFDCEAVRDTFRQWQAEQEPLEAQLRESLSALGAYQSHLDGWQQQLGQERDEFRVASEQFGRERDELSTTREQFDRERDELLVAQEQFGRERDELRVTRDQLGSERDEIRAAREQVDRDRAARENNQSQLSGELDAARDKIRALTTLLLARTEELRTLDNRRAEVAIELEHVRAREKELKKSMEELRADRELERVQRTEEVQHLRELLDRRLESSDTERQAPPPDRPTSPKKPAVNSDESANPVLTSVMEQFGKLRQQRALDRPTFKKTR